MKTLLYILIILFITSCKGGTEFIPDELKGNLLLVDKYREDSTLLANLKISMTLNEKSTEYYYTSKTSANGDFSFSHRPDNYYFSVDTTIKTTGAKYKNVISKANFDAINGIWRVQATYVNSLKIKVVSFKSGQPLNGVPVYLFSNRDFAELAKKLDDAPKSIKNSDTNAKGIVFFQDVGTDSLFILSKMEINKVKFSTPVKGIKLTKNNAGAIDETISLNF
jgi:hypothetical protein